MSTNLLEKFQNQTEREISVLEIMLEDTTILEESILYAKHFVDIKRRKLFSLMINLYRKDIPINFQTLMQHCGGKFDFGGMDTLMEISTYGANKHNFRVFERQIIEFVEIEEQRKACSEFLRATELKNEPVATEVLFKRISESNEQKIKPSLSFKDKLVKRVDQHANMPMEGLSGVDTGFERLNEMTDGWQDSDLIIVAARPSVGKTAFVLDAMRNSARRNIDMNLYKFFSCEMSEEGVIDRWIATEGSLPVGAMKNPMKHLQKWRNGEGLKEYSMAIGSLSNLPLEISEETNLTLIKAEIRKTVKDNPNKKCMFAIDHLGHVKVDGVQDKGERYDIVVNELKELAKQVKSPIILVAQLNRASANREDKAPGLTDIRECGAIEEVADVVIFPHREAYFDKDRRGTEPIQDVELIFAKNRQGKVGSHMMKFEARTNKFFEE
ncbi:hypothetical protein CN446_14960 [Bacillus cereus]|nr:hypothetical protein CN446_14960 [Bacillus cereus]